MSTELVKMFGEEGVATLRKMLGPSDEDRGETPKSVGAGGPVSGISPVVGDVGASIVPSGSVDDAASSETWSEMMESDTSVSGIPLVSEDVRSRVVFGGFGGSSNFEKQSSGTGGMAHHVRSEHAKVLRKLLAALGIKLPKAASWYCALVTHTTATMPGFFVDGKGKLKNLAVLGDSALSAAVAAEALTSGQTVESMQSVKTTRLTDGHLARVFSRSSFSQCVTLATGVSSAHSKTGATALEAIVGLVAYYRSPADVLVLARHLQLV